MLFDRFRGVQEKVSGEGTHFLVPWVQRPIIFDCRSRPRNVSVVTGSKGMYYYMEKNCKALISFLYNNIRISLLYPLQAAIWSIIHVLLKRMPKLQVFQLMGIWYLGQKMKQKSFEWSLIYLNLSKGSVKIYNRIVENISYIYQLLFILESDTQWLGQRSLFLYGSIFTSCSTTTGMDENFTI